MNFEIQILGTSAAVQANGRHQSAQILRLQTQYFLIDCGEGTQEQLVRRKINTNKISKIFISHLHGDHFLGLFGLLSTMSLQGRTNSLEIYGASGLKEIISTTLRYSQSYFNYPIEFIETKASAKTLIFEDTNLQIFSFPLTHGIECTGFRFDEKPKQRRIKHQSLPEGISIHQLKELKKGLDITLDGKAIANETLTLHPKKTRSYAYCSDTSYCKETANYVQKVDLLYHESTFLEKHTDKASATNHSTAKQAAAVALEAQVGKLILGHFSARYKDDSEFEQEAKTIFEASEVAIEGKVYFISDEA